jgi:hypothetical protein
VQSYRRRSYGVEIVHDFPQRAPIKDRQGRDFADNSSQPLATQANGLKGQITRVNRLGLYAYGLGTCFQRLSNSVINGHMARIRYASCKSFGFLRQVNHGDDILPET